MEEEMGEEVEEEEMGEDMEVEVEEVDTNLQPLACLLLQSHVLLHLQAKASCRNTQGAEFTL